MKSPKQDIQLIEPFADEHYQSATRFFTFKEENQMANVIIVENGVEAREQIQQFIDQGFTKDDIYLLAHDNNRSNDLTNALDINNVGVAEQGFFDSFANVFRTRGDELRSKLESLGVSSSEAEQYEREMDQGKVVVLAARSA